jgi:endoglucanase
MRIAILAILGAVTVQGATVIHVNQVGYAPAAPKLAMVASETPGQRFEVHRLPDGGKFLEGPLSGPARDQDSGDQIQIADFSPLTLPGRYEVRVHGARSPAFEVRENPWGGTLRLATRAYYGQRCGSAVDLGGGYAHPACHRDEAFHRTSGKTGKREPTRGWHDAGDYGRYVVNSAITTGTLMWAWELFNAPLRELDLQIPESDNDMPDFLDEVLWNLEWMLSMQDADGGVWQKQTSEQFAPFIAPQADKSVSYVIGTGAEPFKSSCATADLAAVTAIAARVYSPFDRQLAQKFRSASTRAWSWVTAHPEVEFRNPPGVGTGEYGNQDCRDERLWAAAERWRTMSDPEAQAYFMSNVDEAIGAVGPATPPSWAEAGPMAAWTWVLGKKGDEATIASIRDRTLITADAIAKRAREHRYRIPLMTDDFVWGSNAVAANYALHLLVANQMRPDPAYIDAAGDVIHYLLGRNPFSLSWLTGAGSRSVQHPHHRPSATDHIAAPWPGLLAGGPNRNRDDPATRRFPSEIPPARVYIDDQESYSSNEVAINWNAPLVFVLAGLQ